MKTVLSVDETVEKEMQKGELIPAVGAAKVLFDALIKAADMPDFNITGLRFLEIPEGLISKLWVSFIKNHRAKGRIYLDTAFDIPCVVMLEVKLFQYRKKTPTNIFEFMFNERNGRFLYASAG